jgi:hypothetical protein
VDVTQHPAEASEHGAPAIAPAADGDGVMIAGGADRAVYHYREGMSAPAATHPNYGRRPLSVMVLDRSLSETAPGVYSTTVRLKDPGVYAVLFLLDEPRIAECLEARVEAPAAGASDAGAPADAAVEPHLAGGAEAQEGSR